MLSGKELGRAIEQAINKKLASGSAKTKAEIARHFKIKPPSIYDWIRKGSISKEKLPELWSYFSDVVGPDHWGLKELPDHGVKSDMPADLLANMRLQNLYALASRERKAIIDYLLLGALETKPGWEDADVRSYVSTIEVKVHEWQKGNDNKSLSTKTGT